MGHNPTNKYTSFQSKEKRERKRIIIWRNNGLKPFKFGGVFESTNSRSSTNSIYLILVDTYSKTHYNQSVQRQRDNLESRKRTVNRHIQEILNKFIDNFSA